MFTWKTACGAIYRSVYGPLIDTNLLKDSLLYITSSLPAPCSTLAFLPDAMQVYLWVGSASHPNERSRGLQIAQAYVKRAHAKQVGVGNNALMY